MWLKLIIYSTSLLFGISIFAQPMTSLPEPKSSVVAVDAKIAQFIESPSAVNLIPPSNIQPPWVVHPNVDLSEQLDGWAARAGWTLVWEAEYVYFPKLSASFTGDFTSAVTELFIAMKDIEPKLYPVLYRGNRVLLVKNQPLR
ncbi:TcpQ domain-containing protein [Aeromonas sp. MdU4]|uniref:TcpQ domain-containing protein n=1 Tax=Aeromonas sp. MdU4 TaxID=3342819 RepID=UPI0035BA7F57